MDSSELSVVQIDRKPFLHKSLYFFITDSLFALLGAFSSLIIISHIHNFTLGFFGFINIILLPKNQVYFCCAYPKIRRVGGLYKISYSISSVESLHNIQGLYSALNIIPQHLGSVFSTKYIHPVKLAFCIPVFLTRLTTGLYWIGAFPKFHHFKKYI